VEEQNAGYRPTWAQIDLDNLEHNFRQIKKRLAPGVKIMACVKAEAYGHGLIPVARQLASCGVDFLAVASVDEAVALRKAGIDLPVLVLGLVLEHDIRPLFDRNITPTVCTLSLAKALDRQARALGRSMNIHIKIDTGMSRIGIMHDKAYAFVRKIQGLRNIRIEGIFTHLACADSDERLTAEQIGLFEGLVRRLEKNLISIPLVHAANSMGVVSYKNSHFNMVRPGLILYGLYPAAGLPIRLKPVMSLKTKVVFIKDVPSGCGVSYGHTYVTRSATRIATLPIGYGDGYPRNLSNIAPVLINGKRYTIAGRVCMDQIMVDVGKDPVKVGDEVVLIGSQGKERISAESLALLSKTIPYEIVCGIGSRVPRIYARKQKQQPSGVPLEKRKALRRSANLPLRFLDMPSLADSVGMTGDVSASGMRIFTPEQVLSYRRHKICLDLPNGDPVYISGTCVWSKPELKGRYACGFKLDRPLPAKLKDGA
jgi:alanine racemase